MTQSNNRHFGRFHHRFAHRRFKERLAHIRSGHKCRVVGIHAGRRATQRLTDLGVVPGTIVEVVGRGPFGGPLRICFRGTQLAIGSGLAHKVIVDPIE